MSRWAEQGVSNDPGSTKVWTIRDLLALLLALTHGWPTEEPAAPLTFSLHLNSLMKKHFFPPCLLYCYPSLPVRSCAPLIHASPRWWRGDCVGPSSLFFTSCCCTAAGIWDSAVKSTVCNRSRSAVPAWPQLMVTPWLISRGPFKSCLVVKRVRCAHGLVFLSGCEMFRYGVN